MAAGPVAKGCVNRRDPLPSPHEGRFRSTSQAFEVIDNEARKFHEPLACQGYTDEIENQFLRLKNDGRLQLTVGETLNKVGVR
jgi:hypothetical protein